MKDWELEYADPEAMYERIQALEAKVSQLNAQITLMDDEMDEIASASTKVEAGLLVENLRDKLRAQGANV